MNQMDGCDHRSPQPQNSAYRRERHSLQCGLRRPYSAPRLSIFGDVRDLTLGPSAFTNDSGQGTGGFDTT